MDVKRVMDVFAQAATRLEVKVNLLAAANPKKASSGRSVEPKFRLR